MNEYMYVFIIKSSTPSKFERPQICLVCTNEAINPLELCICFHLKQKIYRLNAAVLKCERDPIFSEMHGLEKSCGGEVEKNCHEMLEKKEKKNPQPSFCTLRVPRVIFINPQPLFQISPASSHLDRYEDAWGRRHGAALLDLGEFVEVWTQQTNGVASGCVCVVWWWRRTQLSGDVSVVSFSSQFLETACEDLKRR